jgi:DNA-directed RNA polymerase alpha subunit
VAAAKNIRNAAERSHKHVEKYTKQVIIRNILILLTWGRKMKTLLIDKKYRVSQISEELNLSTLLSRGIRNHFGDPISIRELSQVTKYDFLNVKNFGRKRWNELQTSLTKFNLSEHSVTLIGNRGGNILNVDIDVSKPFSQVIKDLSEIIEKLT